MGAWPLDERRHSTRPFNGDMKPCPKCGEGSCEFNDHYRFEGIGAAPAWVCGRPPCRHHELVRAAHRRLAGPDLIRESRAVQAKATRRMVKSRARAERSRKGLAGSTDRLKKAN